MSGAATASLFRKQLKEMVLICGSGAAVFFGFSLYEGNEKFYRQVMMPSIRFLDPETTHNLALFMAKNKLVPVPKKPDPPSLRTKVWDTEFPNPVGVAAGFDKDGVAVDGMLATGFGFVEVGSVTPEPQPGNPKPRLFRLWDDKAVINRFGFNSEGHDVVRERLKQRNSIQHFNDEGYTPYISEERNMLNINLWTDTSCSEIPTIIVEQSKKEGIIGVNLGKNKTSDSPVEDYVKGVEKFGPLADYLVINVSSPNTPGLRSMQGKQQLEKLVAKVSEERKNIESERKPPLLVKIAPDLTEQDKKDITDVVLKVPGRVDGLIVTNTTVTRPESLKSKYKDETGGLSGEPLKDLSTQTVKDMYRLTKGKLPIIGVGGVACGQDAYDKIRAGASLVQLYTALVYQGPPVVKRIKRELEELLQKDGFSNVSEAVGADVNLDR
ncbi:dihydroorotate dehydrogenase (quinone), mitochondrial-like isoform X1 [Mercenaria mercenaria]|uniref:dihydroorotate dehydrogenase (quinone), mitochondrial-like isoform X1 n=1 Tax=Mercenaria mercenaria TaxID=6596 RepID=UPI001E1E1DF7|nr:dihydroorotate dehydrogenase (quinone), mitochondrial-like isoform X1 [Mercenaria mercenaria]